MSFPIRPHRRFLAHCVVTTSSGPLRFWSFLPLTILLWLSAVPANAEWVRLTEADGMTVHFDPNTIRGKGNLVKMWLLYDYKTAITTVADAVFSTKMQSEYDCIEERVRTNAIFELAGHMGKGKVVSTSLNEGNWTPIAPETIGKREWRVACGK